VIKHLIYAAVLMLGLSGCGKEDAAAPAPSQAIVHIGESYKTPSLQITVESAKIAMHVGEEPFTSKAAGGGEFVAIRWSYKNISSKPISAFETPSIHLVSPDGTVYDTDTGASASYAAQMDTDSKVLSDLNPGIKASDADVFEVSKQLFDPATWHILIKADRDMTIAFARPAVASPAAAPVSSAAVGPNGLIPVMGADAAEPHETTANTSSAAIAAAPTAPVAEPAPPPAQEPPAPVSAIAPTEAVKSPISMGPAFDCEKASTAVEKLICTTPALAQSDMELAGFYKKNLLASTASAGAVTPDALKLSQRAFLAVRNRCETVDCLSEAYRKRYEDLGQLGLVRE
jgi:uncharacterized protein YecT (DUF1311 family)